MDSGSRRGSMLFLGSGGGGWGSVEEGCGMKRRPFFTSGEEVWEEEYYDEQLLPEKKRRLTPEQICCTVLHQVLGTKAGNTWEEYPCCHPSDTVPGLLANAVDLLEKSFEMENKLEPERKSELAKKLGLQPRQVAVWFQNRRARWKTKQLEQDFDRLKASYDSLMANHQSLLKDNDLLRSQVTKLTEKLQEKESAVEGAILKQDDQAPSAGDNNALRIQDSPSTGSGGSAVLGEGPPYLVDSSGESYFPDNYQNLDFLGNRIHSEEDDGSDDGCSYLPGVFEEQHHQAEEASHLGWWVWN